MKFAVLDFETTGHHSSDEIIQIGLILIDENQQIERTFCSFVKISTNIPEFITKLTGITDEHLKDAPTLEDALFQMVPLLENRTLVGHHIAFDHMFLNQALEKCGLYPFTGRTIDTIELTRFLYPGIGGYQLQYVTQHLEIEHTHPHQADSDALATAHLFLMCMKKIETLSETTIQHLCSCFEYASEDLYWFLSQFVEDPRPTKVFDLRVQEWTELVEDEEEIKVPSTFKKFLSQAQKKLQTLFANYEERPAQEEMFQTVHEAFEDRVHLLLEAGTGTGKSIGYLIPAIYHSLKYKQKVVISTGTINLQEQLRDRDLPLLQQVMDQPFRAAVMKGRSNYLCLRKFEQKMQQTDWKLHKEDALIGAQFLVWLQETLTGDKEELHLSKQGLIWWDQLASDAASSLGRACPWFKKCFFHRSRQEGQMSDVIIINHSLLMSDLVAERKILPNYEYVVIDEAHQFEEIATHYLGKQVQAFQVQQWFTQLSNSQQFMVQRLGAIKEVEPEKWVDKLHLIAAQMVKTKEYWTSYFEEVFQWLVKMDQSQEEGSLVRRLQVEESITFDNAMIALKELLQLCTSLMMSMQNHQQEYQVQGMISDLQGIHNDLLKFYEDVEFIQKQSHTEYVYWAEASMQYRARSLKLYGIPVEIKEQLTQMFFNEKSSVIFTSATLTVNQTFDYTIQQFGLTEAETRCKTLPSPFNYMDQSLMVIPTNVPNLAHDSFMNIFIKSIIATAKVINGKTLILFTSYRMLKQTYEGLKKELEQSEIQVFAQGMDGGSRSKLLRKFQQTKSCILLGTSSFWEGVDLPGDSLTCLIIVRLPFQPPNHPLLEAKSERLKQEKQNPFLKLSVPHAVIRFKQGFGRLIRTKDDYGVVIVYDTRIVNSFYGKYFISSLPGPKIERLPLASMDKRIKEWLKRGGSCEER